MSHIERIVPDTKEWDAYYASHISRYQFALDIIKDNNFTNILDIACGVGYGTNFLAAKSNASIIGVDISKEALNIANTKFSHPNIEFRNLDCQDLSSIEDSKFDCIISFETFEHLLNPTLFLNNLFNKLAPSGKLIISTPNKDVSSPEKLDWAYHEKEYKASEFTEMISAVGFRDVMIYGQSLNSFGQLRLQIREEIYNEIRKIYFNPFIRFGLWMQKIMKGSSRTIPIWKEYAEDFNIIEFGSALNIEEMSRKGPFVIILTAIK